MICFGLEASATFGWMAAMVEKTKVKKKKNLGMVEIIAG